ncbi:hypothetical protein STEG23_034373, partial [Scotinomys teguina]
LRVSLHDKPNKKEVPADDVLTHDFQKLLVIFVNSCQDSICHSDLVPFQCKCSSALP